MRAFFAEFSLDRDVVGAECLLCGEGVVRSAKQADVVCIGSAAEGKGLAMLEREKWTFVAAPSIGGDERALPMVPFPYGTHDIARNVARREPLRCRCMPFDSRGPS